jgi:exosortase
MSQPTAPGTEPGPEPAAIASRLVAPAAVLAVLAWAYFPQLANLVDTWESDPNYSHGYLVIPVCAFMFWWLWPRGAEAEKLRPSIWGWVLLLGVVGLRALFLNLGKYWLEGVTIVPTVAALVLAYGGWPLLRKTWPAVAFLVFMYPIPPALNSNVSLPLQRIACVSSAVLLRLLGLWVMDEGNVLIIGDKTLEVAAACNGLAMLMSLSATIVATVILVPMANWKRAILLLSIVPIALLCNIIRISGTAWAYHLLDSAERAQQIAHDVAGWLMMPLALALVLLELAWLSWLVTEEEEARPISPTLLTTASMARPPR